ncbi:MAG: alpha-amylase family glycosyl hydrolase [Dermatophilaceae bacterium]
MNRSQFEAAISPLLELVYPDAHETARTQLLEVTDRYVTRLTRGAATSAPGQGTAVLITYADAIRSEGEAPLATLRRVLKNEVGNAITDVHLLPMFPSTSDDGFAVVDYRKIDPSLGDWSDVAALSGDYRLMFDFVANHVSSRCPWFTDWLAGNSRYDGYFVEFDPAFDVSNVTRPRTSPLFHSYARADGTEAKVWTTFSDDQIDINMAGVAALVEMTDVLLTYIARGASMIRLDAIGFLWKESGTSCMHLPQTHAVVKLWRAVIDYVKPGTQIITETNVPHAENVSYLGNGSDEAHQVYQFALPPLVLHAFTAGTTETLSRWAATITPVSDTATYFNFLASHDGIGMRPSEGILTEDERSTLVQKVLDNGGRASMKPNADGSETVYELNINYLDALANGDELSQPAVVAAKGLAAHSILCSVVGVPAIYYHSLFGSSGDRMGMEASGINRHINREVLNAERLVHELATDERRSTVFNGIKHMLTVRSQHRAFSPYGPQQVQRLDPRVFAVRRGMGTEDDILCIANVAGQQIELPTVSGVDVLTGHTHQGLTLPAYGYAWIR